MRNAKEETEDKCIVNIMLHREHTVVIIKREAFQKKKYKERVLYNIYTG